MPLTDTTAASTDTDKRAHIQCILDAAVGDGHGVQVPHAMPGSLARRSFGTIPSSTDTDTRGSSQSTLGTAVGDGH